MTGRAATGTLNLEWAAENHRAHVVAGHSSALSRVDEVPWLLSRRSMAAVSHVVRLFECDCGVSADEFQQTRTDCGPETRIEQAVLWQSRLDDQWHYFFNTESSQGVVLLNRLGFDVWTAFEHARTKEDARASLGDTGVAFVDALLDHGLLQYEGSQTRLVKRRDTVLQAWLHVTNQCNLRCSYCYVAKSAEAMSEDTGMAAVDAVFRAAEQGGFQGIKLKFAGGEASLNAGRVLAMHDYAKERANAQGLALASVILSNGARLEPRLVAELASREIHVSISLDAIGDAHDQQRRFLSGRGSSQRVVATIDQLVAAGLQPSIAITLTEHNTESLAETVEFILSRNLMFTISFVRDNEQISDYDALRLREQRLMAALDSVFDRIETMLPSYSLLGVLDRASLEAPHAKTCGVGESYIVIDQQGKIASCHMDLAKPVGDVKSAKLLPLIAQPPSGLRNLPVEEKEGCKSCAWRYWCTGGCPKMTYRATGRHDIKSPFCSIYKASFPRLLRLEALRLLKHGPFAGQHNVAENGSPRAGGQPRNGSGA